MADLKESAMTQQSDCKWVRALDANGNSIRISKEDLASVVGELLNPLKIKGILNSTTDLNQLIETGIYYWYVEVGIPLNAPSGISGRGIIKVYNPGKGHIEEWISSYPSNRLWFRTCLFSDSEKRVTDWKEIG